MPYSVIPTLTVSIGQLWIGDKRVWSVDIFCIAMEIIEQSGGAEWRLEIDKLTLNSCYLSKVGEMKAN